MKPKTIRIEKQNIELNHVDFISESLSKAKEDFYTISGSGSGSPGRNKSFKDINHYIGNLENTLYLLEGTEKTKKDAELAITYIRELHKAIIKKLR